MKAFVGSAVLIATGILLADIVKIAAQFVIYVLFIR
jgi:hypothetical protein